MDPQAQASFIPKASLTAQRRGGGGLFTLLAVLVFVVSLVAAGAAFAYQQFLKTSISSQSSSLKNAEGAFNPGVIEDLIRMDARINQTTTLLDSHISASSFFDFLSVSTLERVQFTKFDYELKDDGSAEIGLAGVADTFSTVALQSDEFGASKSLRNVVFSNITVSPLGRVTFNVNATVDPALLKYRARIEQGTPLQ